jgi:hypothetical protein
MVAALGRYWIRGRIRDGYGWTERAVAMDSAQGQTRLALDEAWTWLTWQSNKMDLAEHAGQQWLEHAAESADHAHIGRAMNVRAVIRIDQGLPIDKAVWPTAEKHLKKAGADWAMALLMNDIGFYRSLQGEAREGLAQILEGLSLARQVGDGWLVAMITDSAAWAHADLGMRDEAASLWAEGLANIRSAPDRWVLPNYLEGFARIARLERDPELACVLLAAAAGLRDELGAQAPSNWVEYLQPDVDDVKSRLGEAAFQAGWARGFAMSATDAADMALRRFKPA